MFFFFKKKSFSITQTKDKSRRVNQRRIFARTFVSFVYFDAICKSNNMVMLKLLLVIYFFQHFINVVSHFRAPEDSRLPLFPLPPHVTFLPSSCPLSPPTPSPVTFFWESQPWAMYAVCYQLCDTV